MSALDFSALDNATELEELRFMTAFTHEIEADSGDAARQRLASGKPVIYGDERFPDAVVKEYPDGRRELVTFEGDTEIVIRPL